MTAARQIALGTVMLLVLCLLAGRPQVFSDTKAYYSLGQELALVFTHEHHATSDMALRGRPLSPNQSVTETRLAYTVAASRSPYWSIILYGLSSAGTAWLFVAAQALTAAGTIWLASGAWGVRHAFLPAMATLAIGSSLPVFVLFLMPDLFAGLMILAAAALLLGGRRLSVSERLLLWTVMAGGAAFHTSHMLLLVLLAVGALAWTICSRAARPALPDALLLLSAAAAAVIAAVAYPVGVFVLRHEPIYAPPFVSARLIADGPGRRFLHDTCGRAQAWEWCRFAGRPLDDVNRILWDTNPATATFQAADYTQRVRIIKEQPRFVAAVVSHDPLGVAASVVRNVTHLFFRFGTTEVLEDPTARYRDPVFAVFTHIVPGTERCRDGSKSCALRISARIMDGIIGVTLAASLVTIVQILRKRPALVRQWGPTLLFVLAGLAGNAIICGTLSGDAERYQSRITWLVPLIAVFVVASTRQSTMPQPPVTKELWETTTPPSGGVARQLAVTTRTGFVRR